MSARGLEYIKDYMEIPSIFYCHATQTPFEECLICKKALLKSGVQYVVEKAYKAYPNFTAKDVISEYAICLPCNARMQNTLSAHSKNLIADYFTRRADLISRRQQLLQKNGTDINAWLNSCLIHQTPLSELSEYQIYAHCEGKNLLFSYMPFMLSGKAIEELADLLSAETKEVLDRFVDEHFGLPPELKALLRSRKFVHL